MKREEEFKAMEHTIDGIRTETHSDYLRIEREDIEDINVDVDDIEV
jgi:hypothetical protein